MADIRDLRAIKEKQSQQYVKHRETRKGIVVKVAGANGRATQDVEGRPDYVWVRIYGQDGGVHQVFYRGAKPAAGAAVEVGYRHENSQILEILSYDASAYLGAGEPLPGDLLAETTVGWVEQTYLVPLKTLPNTGLRVDVWPAMFNFGGQQKLFAGQTGFDLSAYVPTTANRERQIALYVDAATGLLGVVAGNEVVTGQSLAIPRLTRDRIPVAAVKLRVGQTGIAATDITDLRSLFEPVMAAMPFTWVFASAAERAAASGFTAADVNRMALQTDDYSMWVLTAAGPASWQAVGGGGGGAGAAGGVFTATYADSNPETVFSVVAGEVLNTVDVAVTEAWNGAGAAVTLGDGVTADLFFGAAETELAAAGIVFTKNFHVAGPVDIVLTITPGAGAGAGELMLQFTTTAG
ncbi:MAG: hypothetical protein FOGNACKC_00935 [Anaerolineae bacterium]|nr:hypothetical protein [Anaerolineae bacterium]